MMIQLKALYEKSQQGYWPYVLSLLHMVLGTLYVYFDPRSNIAFIILMSSLFSIYQLKMNITFKTIAAVVLMVVVMPVLGVRNIFFLEIIFQIAVFSALALGLNIVVGFTGLLVLGYAAFYAVGSYLWAFFGSQQYYAMGYAPGTQPSDLPFLLPGDAFYLFILVAILVTALVGFLIGLPVLRLRGDYLAVVTLGLGEVVRVMANNLDKPINFTNGPQGITPIQRPTMPQFVVDSFNTLFSWAVGRNVNEAALYNVMFYLIALLMIVLIVVLTRHLEDSKIGRAWAAIREDETAAIAMGIPLVRMKLAAFAIGASFAGAMGVIVAASRTFVSPETFSFMQSIGVLSMVILGGVGSIPGVILGATVVTILNLQVLQGLSLYLASLRQSDATIPLINFAWKNLSSQLDPAKYQRLLFGIILILMMIFRPSGLIPADRRKRQQSPEKGA